MSQKINFFKKTNIPRFRINVPEITLRNVPYSRIEFHVLGITSGMTADFLLKKKTLSGTKNGVFRYFNLKNLKS